MGPGPRPREGWGFSSRWQCHQNLFWVWDEEAAGPWTAHSCTWCCVALGLSFHSRKLQVHLLMPTGHPSSDTQSNDPRWLYLKTGFPPGTPTCLGFLHPSPPVPAPPKFWRKTRYSVHPELPPSLPRKSLCRFKSRQEAMMAFSQRGVPRPGTGRQAEGQGSPFLSPNSP